VKNTLRYPSFFVVGAGKSGTTAVWNYFQKHPGIFVTNKIEYKELGYFSDFYGIKDLNKYLSFFEDAQKGQLIGEVCHSYISSPESAGRIHEAVPNAKIIMILRNPVERAYSLYNWMKMHGYESSRSFEIALVNEKQRLGDLDFKINNLQGFYQNYMYLNSGKYYDQLKRYFALFRDENIKVILYKDFKNDQGKIMSDIFKFLGLETIEIMKDESVNVSRRVISSRINFFLKNKMRKFPNARLNRLRKFILNLNTLNSPPKKMKFSTREFLRREYYDDVQKLSHLLGVDLVEKWLE
jgi:hypothetical protein